MKNLLVEYKGGGYDGCYWEWNYFMWDIDGKFHNLRSTGRNGMKDENQAYENMTAITEYDRFEFNYLNLNRENSIVDFVDNGNASLMSFLANEHWQLGEVLKGHCQECGNIFPVIDMFPGDESGDGGLAISAKNLYCDDCMSTMSYNEEMEYKTAVMLDSYLECIEWADCNTDRDPDFENSLGFSYKLKERAENDVRSFLEIMGENFDGKLLEMAGHDLWLTRNGHGTGFWDRPEVYGERLAKKCDDLCGFRKQFDNLDVYVGDDHLIYFGG